MDRIKVLRQRKADLTKEAEALADKDAAGTITDEELARYTAILEADLPKVNASIAREEAVMEAKRTMPAVENVNATTEEASTEQQQIRLPAQAKKEPGKFKSLGEQLQSIALAAMHKGIHYSEIDNRLVYQAGGAGSTESTPSEGGFLVQQDFSERLLDLTVKDSPILDRVTKIPLSGSSNGIILPMVDESSRANGSRVGGVTGYWVDEGGTITDSKPKFRNIDMRLKKVAAVGYATEEMLRDTVALERIFSIAFPAELRFKVENAVVNGTGSGQPLGFLNSGAVVSATPESGQAAGTVRVENILKMWIRRANPNRTSWVWLINQEVEQQLFQMTLGSGTAVSLLYSVPGAVGNATPYGMLLGKPVIITEYNAALGTAGDIVLVDLSEYVMIDKQSIAQAQSMHLRFLTDESAFRFTWRVDGQPTQRVALTPFAGNNTTSPYVVLGAR